MASKDANGVQPFLKTLIRGQTKEHVPSVDMGDAVPTLHIMKTR